MTPPGWGPARHARRPASCFPSSWPRRHSRSPSRNAGAARGDGTAPTDAPVVPTLKRLDARAARAAAARAGTRVAFLSLVCSYPTGRSPAQPDAFEHDCRSQKPPPIAHPLDDPQSHPLTIGSCSLSPGDAKAVTSVPISSRPRPEQVSTPHHTRRPLSRGSESACRLLAHR
jgi:hypothetical protein